MKSRYSLFILSFFFAFPLVSFAQNCSNWLKVNNAISGVQIGDLDVSGNQITIEALINRTTSYPDLYDGGDVVSKHDNPGDNNYLLRPTVAQITTSKGFFQTQKACSIELNKTYHIALVYDGKKLKFYRNGFLMSEVNASGNLYQNNWITKIGTTANTGSPYPADFIGYINEVRIWNVARSQSEIKQYMNQSLPNPASQTGLLAYYTFNDLKNKQGNTQWNGTILGDAVINQTNPTCSSFIADSCGIKTTHVTASFTGPDTVCAGATVKFTNTSEGTTNYLWNFCSAFKTIPDGKQISITGNTLNMPVFGDFGLDDNGNYYEIVTNHISGKITRLNFGNDLLNTPTAEDLGNFNGVIPSQVEGVQVLKVNGRWYAIAVGGGNEFTNSSPRIVKLDFGNSLSNIPVATNWGNIGNLNLPIDFYIAQENGNYYGFTMNVYSNTITRFDFGSDFINTPTGVNLGNIGNLDYPDGFSFIKYNNNWFAFAVNTYSNSITRLNFGSSLTNTPTANIIANPGNFLSGPRDISILVTCNGIFGYVLNANNSHIIKLNFGSDISSTPTATDLGNFGNFNFPHSFSDFFSSGNDIYALIPDVNSNAISRIKFSGCQDIPGSTQYDPNPLTYTQPGLYTVNLMADIGLPTQTSFCKQIVVKNCDTCNLKTDFSYEQNTCNPKIVQFQNKTLNADSIWWDFGDGQTADSTQNPIIQYADYGEYIVHLYSKTNTGCLDTATDTITVAIKKGSAIITNDTSICAGSSVQLNAINGLNYCWSPASSLSDSSTQNPVASPAVTTTYYLNILTASNKPVIQDSVTITIIQPPVVNAGKDTSVCKGSAIHLNASGANTYTWNASVFLSDTTIANPVAAPVNSTKFIVTGYNAQGCFDRDTINVAVLLLPVFTLTNDTAICKGGSIMLQAKAIGNNNFKWSPSTGLSDPNIFNPIASPADSIKYFVSVVDSNNCIAVDSVIVDVLNIPAVSTINDTSICEGSGITLKTNASYASIFKWTPNVELSNANMQSPNASPITSTLYIVTVGNGICSAKDSVLISILSLPVVDANNDTTVCGNSSAQLYATGAVSYSWNPVKGLSDPKIYDPIAAPGSTIKYYVTGTGNNSCTNIDSVTVTVQPAPAFTISPKNIALCKGDSVKLTASGGDTYLWLPSETVTDSLAPVTKVFPSVSTTYRVIITNTACKFTDSLKSNVTVKDVPAVTITKSNDIDCLNFEAQLIASGGMSYQWYPSTYISNTHIPNPVVDPPVDTKYIVVAKNEYSCKTRDSILVQSNILNADAAKFEIANAFTPNHDDLNDCFSVKYWGPAGFFDISIYDRWGYLVYHSNNINSCWDGTIRGAPQGSGTYVYKISVSSKCSNGLLHKKGTVVLMR